MVRPMPLVWVLLGVLVLWVGMRIFGGYPLLLKPFTVLTRREYAFLAAAADATFPRGGAIEPSGTDAEIPRYIDRYLGAVTPKLRFLMRLLFFLLEHATLFFPPGGPMGLRRFSKLSADAQTAYLEGWARSRFFPRRLVITSLRSILTLGYLAAPDVMRQLELAPKQIDTPICEADLLWPRVGEPRASIRYTPADLTPPSDGTPLDPQGPLHSAFERHET